MTAVDALVDKTSFPPAQGWENRRRAVYVTLAVLFLCAAILSVAAAVREVAWPFSLVYGLNLSAIVLVLDGYMRQSRGERADYLKHLSEYARAVGDAVSRARGAPG